MLQDSVTRTTVMGSAPDTDRTAKSHAFTKKRCPCCGPFGAFLVVAFFALPMLIFALSAFFALPLWAIECADDVAQCEFYQW